MLKELYYLKEKVKIVKKAKAIGKIILKILIAVFSVVIFAGVLLLSMAGMGKYMPGKKANPDEITNPYIATENTMVSAHRSGAKIAPENTMMAFKRCVESEDFQVDIFEFDLHITKDDKLILLHDDTLDRTTDAQAVFGGTEILPSEKTYEELTELNFGAGFTDKDGNMPYKDLHGDQVPEDLRVVLLEDVLDYMESQGDYRYIIEIKDSGELGYKATDKLYEIIKGRGLLEKVVFGTFNGEVTKYATENYPDMLRSSGVSETILFYFLATFNIDIDEDNFKFSALQIPAHGYKVFYTKSERLINYAHRKNIAVQYWTINDEETVEELSSKGADCVMSDYPDMAYDVIYGQ